MKAVRLAGTALAALAFAVLVAAPAVAEEGAEMVRRTMSHGGVERVYYVYVPPELADKAKPAPLVVALHDGGGRAERFARMTQLGEAARKAGFIVVFPEGIEQYWNDGRSRVGLATFVRNTDDVGFITALIAEIGKSVHAIDPKRVFAAGMANGGMMAIRLACEAADTFAGIVTVAASMPDRMEHRCRPSKPVSVLMIHGSNDTMIPFRGGGVRAGLKRMGAVISTEATVEFFAQHNGCALTATPTRVPNRSPDDSTETTRREFPECRNSTVVFYEVDRGGHTWPGAKTRQPERVVGKTSRDFDASTLALDFFKSLPARE